MTQQSNVSRHFGGIGRALSSPNYRTYWYGHLFSSHGVWIHRVSSGWLIFELTHSPGWLGAIGFAYAAPLIILGPVAGAVSDRFGHRRTAITGSILGIIISLITALLAFTGIITPVLLFILGICQGIVMSFEFPSRVAIIPNLIERKDLSAAIGTNSTTFFTAASTGPPLGALIISVGSAELGFVVAAFCMACMVIALSRIRYLTEPRRTNSEDGGGSLVDDILSGLSYTFNHPQLRAILVLSVSSAFLLKPYIDLLPGFAADVFDQPVTGLGTLLGASGAGSLVASVLFALRGRTQGLTRFFGFGMAASALTLIVFSMMTDLWMGAAVMALAGGFLIGGAVSGQTLLQNVVDSSYRARVISINLSLVVGLPALSTLVVGGLAEWVGLPWAVSLAAAVLLVILPFSGRNLLRHAATMETVPGEV